jgi:4-amino-4-deoxy-L-arabinose transferase-like glycosyltransferase
MAVNETTASIERSRSFWPVTAGAVVLGAAIRFSYVLTDRRGLIVGDAYSYHVGALRLADGLGYTDDFAKTASVPLAHHPPGWVTVLGLVSWLGGRSQTAHQTATVVIGLGVIVVAGLIGRRYFNPRVGAVAALIAALYPGFWVLEGNYLSEPLGLLLLGILTLMLYDLRDRPTVARSLVVGGMLGLLGLVRSEELALLVFVIAPVLLLARRLTVSQRWLRLGAVTAVMVAVLLPWAIYNQTRFEKPVPLSTNGGSTLLAGNCPPATYSGKLIGFYGGNCLFKVAVAHPGVDRSVLDPIQRDLAFENMVDNVDRLPATIAARVGRTVGVFRPTQTVGFVADWMTTDTGPIWAWVISFWILVPLAVVGVISARRSRAFLLPLLGPLVIVLITVALSYGEPRYHTLADLGIIVLAALGVERLVSRLRRVAEPERDASSERTATLAAVSAP